MLAHGTQTESSRRHSEASTKEVFLDEEDQFANGVENVIKKNWLLFHIDYRRTFSTFPQTISAVVALHFLKQAAWIGLTTSGDRMGRPIFIARSGSAASPAQGHDCQDHQLGGKDERHDAKD
ncbi:hypothetical protein C5E08_09985 [Rathayibacter iranicus]|uniref:Uncharacterized protein n=1 Tax=Rathayibacter iranicus TaxID=59737 RepID=A0AAD1ADI0_9MICO|nr:hypothetical protein C7V51_10070 [Rathayibacter iranicus]PPI46260.1 hypothetical protein C5E09_09060 [Rathayibacter iranicus]PPI59635.1 hypothetical protein C5E08_09985 [Rathayibacter iranicus]PPI71112.1 hypothetical protein C5E01_09025 [Rathayibacter iranicus]